MSERGGIMSDDERLDRPPIGHAWGGYVWNRCLTDLEARALYHAGLRCPIERERLALELGGKPAALAPAAGAGPGDAGATTGEGS
ncbi:hypothetical protein [Tautonia plasticadhaerens]|uniref:Uncharacterized protein n=1 Tax=Tautonia plasticadhaerens TaxID=2527974 RepID=A0A518H3T0_9BACT|nr:hypothetical protein [Tautonia plasticadhaerens]QDV35483.1 hypothetical protein ElP_33860 [Tautonia plasticadhaerens]